MRPLSRQSDRTTKGETQGGADGQTRTDASLSFIASNAIPFALESLRELHVLCASAVAFVLRNYTTRKFLNCQGSVQSTSSG